MARPMPELAPVTNARWPTNIRWAGSVGKAGSDVDGSGGCDADDSGADDAADPLVANTVVPDSVVGVLPLDAVMGKLLVKASSTSGA